MTGLPGRIEQRGSNIVLIVTTADGQEVVFIVEQLQEGVFELVDEHLLIINSNLVDIIIVSDDVVVRYCESQLPHEAFKVTIH